MKEEYQRVYAQIDLDALIRNVQHIKANMKQGVSAGRKRAGAA